MMEYLSNARHRAPHPAGAASVGRVRSRLGEFAVVAEITVETRERLIVPIEDDAEHLAGLHNAERLANEPTRRPMSCHNEQETVHPVGNDSAVLDGAERGRVHDHVVVVVASL